MGSGESFDNGPRNSAVFFMVPTNRFISALPAIAVSLFCASLAAIGWGLYANADRMRPAQPGNARDFWLVAAWVTPANHEASLGDGGRIQRDGERYYYTRGWYNDLYVISRIDVMAYWPTAQAQLETNANDADRNGPVEAAYREWRSLGTDDVDELLARIERNCVEDNDFRRKNEPLYEHLLHERISRLRYYPANFVFEFVWLSALAWLVFSPLFLRPSIARGFFSWFVALVFFFLPAYLGYALTALGSCGARGGVLYPRLLQWTCLVETFDIDRSLLKRVPPCLAEFSQQQGPIPLDNVSRLCGPLAALIIGLVLGIMGATIAKQRRQCCSQLNENLDSQ